jgi:hypothetical protein
MQAREMPLNRRYYRQSARPPNYQAALMDPKHYHTPRKPVSTRVSCPVCHEDVYSRAGIHPQCVASQADPPKPKNKVKK